MSLRREEEGGFVFWAWEASGNAVFTSRVSGQSTGPFASLNLGERTEDEPGNVRANREMISAALGISPDWHCLHQVHGAAVWDPTGLHPGKFRPQADAIVAGPGGPPLAVVSADCLPIALMGKSLRGVIHAGWRGLCAGVIDETISRASVVEHEISASIGPSIGPCHYAVGDEVVGAFRRTYPEAPDFSAVAGEQLFFDLRAAARWVLRQWRVQVDAEDPPCTFCEPLLYSHRRDGATGRQAVIVW